MENPRFIMPVEVKIYDENKVDTGDIYYYVSILKTLRIMLLDKNVRVYCGKIPEYLDGYFDLTDGLVEKKKKINSKIITTVCV